MRFVGTKIRDINRRLRKSGRTRNRSHIAQANLAASAMYPLESGLSRSENAGDEDGTGEQVGKKWKNGAGNRWRPTVFRAMSGWKWMNC